MQQHSPSEIKQRLLKALDKEYNVVDMGTVLEIVTILERTPITKEALETTRLGRDINELRRKTKNESLAKRAKDLVRRWRDLIISPRDGGGEVGVTSGSTPVQQQQQQQNGSSTRTAPYRSSPAVSAAPKSNPISPAVSLPNSDKSSVSPALSTTRLDPVPKTHAANKRLRKEGTSPSSELPLLKKLKKDDTDLLATVPAATERDRVNGDHYPESVESDCEIVSVTPATPTPKVNSRQKKAPKDRTKKSKGGDDIVKEKIASIARIHKVKTTQELLAGLQSRSGDNCALPQALDHDVAKNKTEHLVRFLRSTGDVDQDETVDVDDRTDSETDEEGDSKKADGDEQPPPFPTPEEILAKLPPLDLNSIQWDDSPVPSPPPEPLQVSESDVDRVLNDEIDGVNGNYELLPDGSRVFRRWHEMLARPSVSNELLHVLPYVVID